MTINLINTFNMALMAICSLRTGYFPKIHDLFVILYAVIVLRHITLFYLITNVNYQRSEGMTIL